MHDLYRQKGTKTLRIFLDSLPFEFYSKVTDVVLHRVHAKGTYPVDVHYTLKTKDTYRVGKESNQ